MISSQRDTSQRDISHSQRTINYTNLINVNDQLNDELLKLGDKLQFLNQQVETEQSEPYELESSSQEELHTDEEDQEALIIE